MSPQPCGCQGRLLQVYVTELPVENTAKLTLTTELIYCPLHGAAEGMQKALALIAALPSFRSSGSSDNAGNRANLLAAKDCATTALAQTHAPEGG